MKRKLNARLKMKFVDREGWLEELADSFYTRDSTLVTMDENNMQQQYAAKRFLAALICNSKFLVFIQSYSYVMFVERHK